jgi:hypothetical protein
MDINISQGRVTMKTVNSNKSRIAFIALPTLVVLFLFSHARAQTSQDGPSFQDTTNYLTTFLGSHGCTEYDTNLNHKEVCISLTKTDSCVIELEVKLVLTPTKYPSSFPPSPKLNRRNVNLQLLDPTSLKTGPDIHSDDGSFPDRGLDVIAQAQAGGIGLALPVDNTDNATHLINALSHAITVCGGKKAAF